MCRCSSGYSLQHLPRSQESRPRRPPPRQPINSTPNTTTTTVTTMSQPCATPKPPTYTAGFHDPEAVKKMTYRPLGNTGRWVVLVALHVFSSTSAVYDPEFSVFLFSYILIQSLSFLAMYGGTIIESLLHICLSQHAVYYSL